jgi:tetratricopeptide (TPR) repeat protein
VRNRILSISLLVALGLWSAVRPATAQALIPHIVQLDPAKLERQGLGLAQEAAQLAQLQQYELALPRAELATQLAPKKAEIWSLLGGLYLQTTKIDQAIVALNQSKALNQKNPSVMFALGSAYFQKTQYAKSVEYLQAGLALKPDVPGAMFDLGNAHLMLRQFPQAIAQYEKAVAQDKKFWPAINNIGLIQYEIGNVPEAIQRWKDALEIDKKAAEPRLALAVALYSRGDREQGLTLGELAIQTDSRYSDLKFLKENLWGDRLLADTKKFLELPRIKATIAQAQGNTLPKKTRPASR